MVLVHSVAANQLGGTKTALTRAGVPAERIGVRANGSAHEIYVPEEYEAAAKAALSGHTYTAAGSKGKNGVKQVGGILKGGILGPAMIAFAAAVSFVQPGLALVMGTLGIAGTIVLRKLADNERSKIDAMYAAGLDWTVGQRLENIVTGSLVWALVAFTVVGLALYAAALYGFDSVGLLQELGGRL